MHQNSNQRWFYIKAIDGSSQGYFPAIGEVDACHRMGLESSQCNVVEVVLTEEGFRFTNEYVQERLF